MPKQVPTRKIRKKVRRSNPDGFGVVSSTSGLFEPVMPDYEQEFLQSIGVISSNELEPASPSSSEYSVGSERMIDPIDVTAEETSRIVPDYYSNSINLDSNEEFHFLQGSGVVVTTHDVAEATVTISIQPADTTSNSEQEQDVQETQLQVK